MKRRLCKHKKLILAKGIIEDICPDEEPYKSGEYIKMDNIYVGEQVLVRYCPKCETIVEAWVEE